MGDPERPSRVRRAYVCAACQQEGRGQFRVFLREGERVPRCPRHGKLQRQPNAPYRGKKPPLG
jgi:hypothetical protein